MKKIRIGNDFTLLWAIERDGEPEDLVSASDKKLTIRTVYDSKELQVNIVDTNKLSIDFTPEIITRIADYNLLFTYTLPDIELSDQDRKCSIDLDCFTIVPNSALADAAADFSVTSDMAIGFHGDNAFIVWQKIAGNEDKTEDDYFDFLQLPATEVAEAVTIAEGLRVIAEDGRVEAEELRVTAEEGRVSVWNIITGWYDSAVSWYNGAVSAVSQALEDIATAIGLSETATGNAQNAADLANEKAGLADDAANAANQAAEAVVDGRSVEIQNGSGYIQWRLVGDTNWTNIISIASITPANAKEVELQVAGGYIQWELTGGSWTNLIQVSTLVGATGKGITSITRTSGNGAAGTTDTYTITFSDSTTSTFTVVNGANAYQSYVNTTSDSPVLTETEWSNQLTGVLTILNSI
jgi:hypothetical protein